MASLLQRRGKSLNSLNLSCEERPKVDPYPGLLEEIDHFALKLHTMFQTYVEYSVTQSRRMEATESIWVGQVGGLMDFGQNIKIEIKFCSDQ